ncbi:MAG: hypothetical protein JOZ02_20140 [Acidobacteria bacterium]|nr:hypothetical protein [Acidobacteriota bacterium]
MKHRSVIAFVIIAAALFSLPQLSHDLHALKGAVGARLHRELLHAFLSLPAGEPTAAAPAARPAESLLAFCPKTKSGAQVPKTGRVEASGRAAGKSFEQGAMLGDPKNDPINNEAKVVVKEADKVFAPLPEVRGEVAMLIPPDAGIDPRALAHTLTSADGLRVDYSANGRSEAKDFEWQKATEEAVRTLNATLPASYEFRVVRDGAKTKVLRLKCGGCPATTPRAPQQPRQLPAAPPAPVTFTSAEWAGE